MIINYGGISGFINIGSLYQGLTLLFIFIYSILIFTNEFQGMDRIIVLIHDQKSFLIKNVLRHHILILVKIKSRIIEREESIFFLQNENIGN